MQGEQTVCSGICLNRNEKEKGEQIEGSESPEGEDGRAEMVARTGTQLSVLSIGRDPLSGQQEGDAAGPERSRLSQGIAHPAFPKPLQMSPYLDNAPGVGHPSLPFC